jgi:hypothetical protein
MLKAGTATAAAAAAGMPRHGVHPGGPHTHHPGGAGGGPLGAMPMAALQNHAVAQAHAAAAAAAAGVPFALQVRERARPLTAGWEVLSGISQTVLVFSA